MTVRAGICLALAASSKQPPPATHTIYVGGRARGGGSGDGGGGGGVIVPRGRRRNDCDRKVIPNPCIIQRLCIISEENMRGMCRDVAFPTLNGVAF